MEDIILTKSRKKNKKPIYFLAGVILLFGVFVYLITRKSLQTKAIEKIEICNNVNDVKFIYDQNKFNLMEIDENGNKIVATDFQKAIRDKLNEFNLSEKELEMCLEWLPPAKTSLNVIVIPDLSRRINDPNNSGQISNDIFILETVWKSFVKNSKFRQDSKDRITIDVTDIDQAKGRFGDVADKLQFDLSEHKGKSNILFFTPEKDKQFESNIRKMYQLAKDQPLGADYRFYFRRYLNSRLKKNTIYDTFINKVIIITDGYLEAENKPADTKIYGYQKVLYSAVQNGNVLNIINSLQLNIPKVDIDLSNTDILICEVNERREGIGYDFEILKVYWEDWLNHMNPHKKPLFYPREQANKITQKRIEDFINY